MIKNSKTTAKTRGKLINAFWTLYKDKSINKITANTICSLANYERTTFYRYFKDINDILNQLENEIISNIKESIKSSNNKSNNILFDGFKEFDQKYGEFIIVFYEKGNTTFNDKFKKLIKEDVFTYFNFNIKEENKKEFLFEMMFSSLINSYSYWYRHKRDISLDAFVEFANNVMNNGIKSFK